MRTKGIGGVLFSVAALSVLAVASPASAGGHTWVINEVFSNADGTVQFIETRECCGGNTENATAGHQVTSNTNSVSITANSSNTAFRHILFGTLAYDALPNSPTPDYFIPANFFSVNGDTITYSGLHTAPFGPGALPTNGVQSLNRNGGGPGTGTLNVVATNSPTNHSHVTGSVNAAPPPPAIPDGDGASTPMTAAKLDPSGSSLSVSWDTTTCSIGGTTNIIYGQGSQFPAVLGGTFGLTGSACAVGASPYTWNPAPSATDATGLLWWLIVVKDGTGTEGSWGHSSDDSERKGPGPLGSSAECGTVDKDTSNLCGQ